MAIVNDLVTKFSFAGSLAPLMSLNKGISEAVNLIPKLSEPIQQVSKDMADATKTSESLGGAFSTAFKGIPAFTAAFLGAASGLIAWATSISQANDETGRLSRDIGVTVEALGELGFAAQQNGSGVEELQSSLSNLAGQISETAKTGSGEGAVALNKLGISVRNATGQVKTADQVFMEFATKAKDLGLSGAQIEDFGAKLGIDSSLVQTIKLGGDGIADLRAKAILLGRTTTEQSDQMLAYNDSLVNLKRGAGLLQMGFEGLKVKVATALIPTLTNLSEIFANKLSSSAEMIGKVFTFLGKIFTAIIESVIRMTPVMLAGAAVMGVMRLAAMGLAGAMNLLKRALPIAIILALYAVIDDLVTAFQGGNSVIADFYSELSGGRSLVEDFTNIWNILVDTFKTVWSWVTKVWEVIGPFMAALGSFVLDALIESFKLFIGTLVLFFNIVDQIVGIVADLAVVIYDFTLDAIVGAWDALISTLHSAREIILNVFDVVGKLAGIIGGLAVGGLIAMWDGFTNALKKSFEWLDAVFEKLKLVGNIAGSVRDGISDIGGKAAGAVTSAFDSTKSFLGFGKKDKNSQPSMSTTAQMIPGTNTTSTNNNTVNQEVKINVQSTDPVQAGNEVQAKLSSTLQDGQNQTGAVAR